MAKGRGEKRRGRKAPVEPSVASSPEQRPPNPAPVEALAAPPPPPTFEQEVDAVLDVVRTDLRTKMALAGVKDLLEPKGERVFSRRVYIDVDEQIALRVDALLAEIARGGSSQSVEAIDALMAELCLLRIATSRRTQARANPMLLTALAAGAAFSIWPIIRAMHAKKTAP